MPEPQSSIPPLQSIAALIGEACAFAESRDVWLERYGLDRGHSGDQRLTLVDARRSLQHLARAIGVRRSVGFYGESQCGKSNLVSRIGRGLGARATDSGSLLVKDPSVPGTPVPWESDGVPGCIEFAKWLNPVAASESTGVICRLTTDGTRTDVPEGCFRARMMSQADLVISLAIGNADDTEYAGSRSAVQQEMLRLRALPTEDDRERFTDDLLVAWNFLLARWGGEDSPSARARDLIDAGWRDYLRELFLGRRRPVWDPRTESSPYVQMASMLWSGQRELSAAFRLLLQASDLTGGASEVAIEAAQACRSDQPPHHSILDVRNIDGLFDEPIGSRGVQVRFGGAGGAWRSAAIPRSMLSALIRELELPLAMDGDGAGASVDVLDYPGARPTSAAGQVAGDLNPLQRALTIFRRGKLNYLFLAGVGLQDSSALCLVVTGNGPLNAGPVVREALRQWLRREDPDLGDAPPAPVRRMGGEVAPPPVDPPMVVAVSKSDMLINESAGPESLFGVRLREVAKEYCARDIPWFQKWPSGGPFRRVHWVHNPDAPGAVRLREYLEPGRAAALARIREAYLADAMVLGHVVDHGTAFDRLFRAPADVDALFDTIAEVVRGVRREERILDDAIRSVEPIVAAVNRDYLGPDSRARVEAERREANADVDALEAVLRRGRNPVAMLLRALQLSAVDVQRACRAARDDVARAHPGEIGALSFDEFFGQLSKGFVDRLERRLPEQCALAHALRASSAADGARSVLLSLREHFAAMPGTTWFREQVRGPVGKMFDAMNADALVASPVLGAVVSTAWNRCVVWLDRQPEVLRSIPEGLPRRRPMHASSARILQHWRERLPAVYEGMVDPAGAARPGNAELGTIRESLRRASEATLGALCGAGVAESNGCQGRLRQLEEKLRQ